MQPLTFEYYDIPATICILAGVCYLILYQELQSFVKLIFLILFLNITTDTANYLIMHNGVESNIFYNILNPVERVVTLYIYAKNVNDNLNKRKYFLGSAVVLVTYLAGYYNYDTMSTLHDFPNIITGLIVSMLSYFQLRSISIGKAGQSRVLFFFGLANLIYYTLMISAMSAFPLALKIGYDFASDIIIVNLVGYTLWSVILIIGILWKKKQKT